MLETFQNIFKSEATRKVELDLAIRTAVQKTVRSEHKRFRQELKTESALAYKRGRIEAFRTYAAGQVNRLTEGWSIGPTSINADIRTYLSAVRERARDLVKNFPHPRRFINLCKTNIVGPFGFRFQSNVRELVNGEYVEDAPANVVIEDRFTDWGKAENCDISGRYSFRMLQQIIIGTVPRDGEILIRLIRSNKLKYGFALQVLEADLLDHLYNEKFDNGNVVQMGVELDEWRRPVAYWVREPRPELEIYGVTYLMTQRTRIPASEMLHIMHPDFINQTRGISWMAPGMTAANMLSGYEESTAVHARWAASSLFILKNGKIEPGTEMKGQGKDAQGNILIDAPPGSTVDIQDKELQDFNPDYPSMQYEMFVNAMLRSIASAWNISYSSLSNDLSQASYGSNRVGMLDEREGWKLQQEWFAEAVLVPIFSVWLKEALLAGAITINGKPLPIAKLEKFNAPIFTGRRWSWIDPLKDVLAELALIEGGLKTATQSLAERGEDIKEVYKELGTEKALAAKYGLILSTDKLALSSTLKGIADPQGDGAPAPAQKRENYAHAILAQFRDILLAEEQAPSNGHKKK